MSYAQYLRDILRSLHIYDLDNGIGADEIDAEGAALDALYDELETLLCEIIPLTDSGYGLERYESILPYKPVYSNLYDRRSAIAALTFAEGFSLDEINRCLPGIGIEAVVSEYGTETVAVSFPGCDGTPENLGELKKRIEQITPCHLDIVYGTVNITFGQFDNDNFTWQGLEYEKLTWLRLQLYDMEV